MQLWTALKGLNKEVGVVVYQGRDYNGKLQFPVYLKDEEIESAVTREATILTEAWKEKTPPPVPDDLPKWKGVYCRWHKQCLQTNTITYESSDKLPIVQLASN